MGKFSGVKLASAMTVNESIRACATNRDLDDGLGKSTSVLTRKTVNCALSSANSGEMLEEARGDIGVQIARYTWVRVSVLRVSVCSLRSN